MVGYEEVKQAILGRRVMSHAAATEAFFSHNNKELLAIPVTQAVTKMKRWLKKMEQGAESEDVRRERVVMGSLRSQMVPELKTYLDLSKPQNGPELEALVEQWTISQPYKRSSMHPDNQQGQSITHTVWQDLVSTATLTRRLSRVSLVGNRVT